MKSAADDITPRFLATPFACPHCRQFARQTWGQVLGTYIPNTLGATSSFDVTEDQIWLSKCDACQEKLIWKCREMVWPHVSVAPEASADFPDGLRADYEEARQIHNCSPRASAAILRLCLQKLCVHLGASGDNINNDIQHLYDEFGLGRRVRDSMDILRVVGNNAVHPGEINLDDNREISIGLFRIINFVIDKAISEPAHVDSIFAQLPENAREAIERREARAAAGRPQLEPPSS